MENKKPNLINIVFSVIGVLLIAGVGITKGVIGIIDSTDQYSLGKGVMFAIVSGLMVVGLVFNVIAEFCGRKDVNLVGLMTSCIGFAILLFMETGNAGITPFAACSYFAYCIFKVLASYTDKAPFKIVSLVLASVTLFVLVIAGVVGIFANNFHMYYVGYIFGYIFFGLAAFISSLFEVISKKEPTQQA